MKLIIREVFKVVYSNIFMVMEFCPKCKSILIPKMENGKLVIHCSYCGYSRGAKVGEALVETEKMPRREEVGEGVVDSINEFATYDNKCEKCGFGKAQIVDMGQWYSDEDNIIILRCGKCGWSQHMERKSG